MLMEDFTLTKKRLGDLLILAGLMSEADLHLAITEQKRSGKRIGETLIDLKLVTEIDIAKTLSDQLGIEYISLQSAQIESDALAAVPEAVARQYDCIPVTINKKQIALAMTDPLDYLCMQDVGFRCEREVRPLFATRGAVLDAIKRHYKRNHALNDSIEEEIRSASVNMVDGEQIEISPAVTVYKRDAPDSLQSESQSAPIVRLFNLIFVKAMKSRASDIHLDPHQNKLAVRFRVDGILQTDRMLQKEVLGALVSRIKVLAALDISERRLPQDGAIRVKFNKRNIDLRISTLPTHYGEKVVIRILDQSATPAGLSGTGMAGKTLENMHNFAKRHQGILLVTGPTGSGKSSTLYSFINHIRSEKLNIMTVEDPVEYNIEGLNQIQVKSAIGLTFANCLRSILRQDPNVIMLGEIRDLETAEIAMRAAMTGHLVISTLHTNDAISTVTRLVDMGIPRYLVASTIIGIVAQRLVRKICVKCRTQVPTSEKGAEKKTAFKGKGCAACAQTGFFGRVGIFESLTFESKVREIITAGGNEEEIGKMAEKQGFSTMGEDGLEKVHAGLTTLEEVHRVIDVEEEMPAFCPKCQEVVHLDFVACPHCKHDIQRNCSFCKKHLQAAWLICPYCRTEPESQSSVVSSLG